MLRPSRAGLLAFMQYIALALSLKQSSGFALQPHTEVPMPEPWAAAATQSAALQLSDPAARPAGQPVGLLQAQLLQAKAQVNMLEHAAKEEEEREQYMTQQQQQDQAAKITLSNELHNVAARLQTAEALNQGLVGKLNVAQKDFVKSTALLQIRLNASVAKEKQDQLKLNATEERYLEAAAKINVLSEQLAMQTRKGKEATVKNTALLEQMARVSHQETEAEHRRGSKLLRDGQAHLKQAAKQLKEAAEEIAEQKKVSASAEARAAAADKKLGDAREKLALLAQEHAGGDIELQLDANLEAELAEQTKATAAAEARAAEADQKLALLAQGAQTVAESQLSLMPWAELLSRCDDVCFAVAHENACCGGPAGAAAQLPKQCGLVAEVSKGRAQPPERCNSVLTPVQAVLGPQ